jgi:hypothetical protein
MQTVAAKAKTLRNSTLSSRCVKTSYAGFTRYSRLPRAGQVPWLRSLHRLAR